jgi:hypothetical protein
MPTRHLWAGAVVAAVATACGPGGVTVYDPSTTPPAQTSSPPVQTTATPQGDAPAAGETKDAPEISRSGGEAGGVVVFWPRIIPRSDDAETRAMAAAAQERVVALVRQALPGKPVDVRPEPERVCPQDGCAAMTVGLLLTRSKDSCAALALVSPPGKSPSRILPWVGDATVHSASVPFREPPEKHVKLDDLVRCSKLVEGLDKRQDPVAAEIRSAAGR